MSFISDGGESKGSSSITWVVEHEGWLMKRGAGYTPPQTREGEGVTYQAKTKKPLKKRRGTLVKGKTERRRYFTLVTPKLSESSFEFKKFPLPELRYYTDNPKTSDSRKKGVVVLQPDITVHLTDASSISIVTEKRTYYLRPDVPDEESSSAHARISAGQWHSALYSALEGLRSSKLAKLLAINSDASTKEKVAHSPVQDSEALKRVNHMAQEARKEELLSFDRSDEKRLFVNLWVPLGLEAYNSLVGHFGPVRTDCQRLLDHFELNVEQMQKQVQVLEQNSYVSQELSLTEQRNTRNALKQYHRLTEDRKDAVNRCIVELKRDAVQPMRKMIVDMDTKLESIVKYQSNASKDIVRHRKILEASIQHSEWLESKLKDMEISESEESTSRRPSLSHLRRPSMKGKPKYLEELEAAVTAQHDIEEAVILSEKKHTAQMVAAIDSIEELERNRLTRQKTVLVRSAEAEIRLFENLASMVSSQSEILQYMNTMDPAEDVKATSDKLLQSTKSTLPTLNI